MLATFVLGVVLRLPTFGRPLLSDDEAIYADDRRRARARGPAVPRRRRSQAAAHLPRLPGRLRRCSGSYDTHGAHALVVLAVLLTAGFLFAIKRQEGRAVARATALRRRRPGGGGPVPGLLDDLARLRRAGGELRAVPAAPQAIAAWLLLRDLRAPARGRARLGASSGGGRAHRNVGPLQVSGPDLSRRLDRYAALVGAPADEPPELWAVTHGALPGGRRAGAARALPLGCRGAGNARGRDLLVQVQFLVRRRRPDGLRRRWRADCAGRRLVGGAALVPYALGIAAAVTAARDVVRGDPSPVTGAPPASAEVPSPVGGAGRCSGSSTSAVAVTAGGRFFGHYFHLILAPLCLLAAPGFCRLWTAGAGPRRVAAGWCCAPCRLCSSSRWRPSPGRSPPRSTSASRRYDEVAARIDRAHRAPTSASSSGGTPRSSTSWRAARWEHGSRSATT